VQSDGLIEKVRTNIVLQSNTFNTTWVNTNSTETSGQAGYDGTNNAWLLDKSGASGQLNQSVSTSGLNTFSVYAKAGTSNFLRLTPFDDSFFDLANGIAYASGATTISANIVSVGNGWYRCTITATSGTETDIRVLFYASTSDSVYLYGAQLEQASYATSYIPTLGASVTRVADVASKTGISSLIGQTEGTLFLDANISNLSEARRGIVLYADANNYITLRITSTNLLQFLVFASGAIQASITIANPQGNVKMALAYKANDFAAYLNGTLVGTDTSGSVPATSEFYLGVDPSGVNQLAGGINQVLLFKTRLTNDQLAELTSL
jgi:hypothetical protein